MSFWIAHLCCGATFIACQTPADPRPTVLEELIPDWRDRDDFPLERWVEEEEMVYLTKTGSIKAPLMPPPLHDKGMPIISIGRFQKWLAEIAEEKGVMIFPGFAGNELLWSEDDKQVIGVHQGQVTRDAEVSGG